MTRVLLTALLLGMAAAQGQTYLPRSELKKPLPEAVEKTLGEFLDKCVPEKKKQLTAHMEEVMKAVDAAVELTDDEKKAMEEPTGAAIEAAVKSWRPLGLEAMRTYLSRTSEAAAIRHVGVWKPEQAGPNEPVEGWTPPQESADWLAALERTLGEERFTRWNDSNTKAAQKEEKEIMGYLERWVRESRGPMNEDLEAKIALMKERLRLSEEKVDALKKAAAALLDRLSESERMRALDMLRTLPPEARKSITGRSNFYLRFDRPRGEAWDKMWTDASAKILSSAEIAQWGKVVNEERVKAEAELADLIKPSEVYLRQQMEAALLAEMEGITTDLELGKERSAKLKELSEKAVEESLKLARKQWMQQVRNYSTAERQRMRANTYFGLNEEQQAASLPVWKDGVKKLLTEEERTRMTRENDAREKRTLGAIAQACLAEMDRTLMLNDGQRAKLEPLLQTVMRPFLEQRRQQYWSFNAQQLFNAANQADMSAVDAVLDEVQRKHWRTLVSSPGGSSGRSSSIPTGTPPEAPDKEAAISEHLYKMFVTERKKVLAAMLPQVEDARRVLSLPEDKVARLTTAAKGAVEQSLAYWRQNTERYVRQSVQSATPKNILQALAGAERVSFSRNESSPQSGTVWREALEDMLDKAQLETLEQTAKERRNYRLKAMASMTAAELDRRRRLGDEQFAKVEAQVRKILADYQPDIERYMSPQWFLQYYYALVPLAGVPEKELQGILTPQQWKLCKDRDMPDAMQYWEGIENNHKNRLKQGAKANMNPVIFNGGLIIDE